MTYMEGIDIMGVDAGKAPLVSGGIRWYYATGTDGIEESAAQIAAAKAAGMGVVLIDQTPSLSVFAAGMADEADIEQYAGTNASAAAAVAQRQAHGLASVLYVSEGSWAGLKAAIASPAGVFYHIANWSFSLAEAQYFIASNPDVVAVQYGDPASNPNTLVPGTSVNLTQCNADIDVCLASWAARFIPAPTPPGPTPKPPNPAPPPVNPVLQEGDTGPAVVLLQTLLDREANAGLAADGDFGPLTLAAVKAYQSSRGLTVDGIVGPQTWAALNGNKPPAVIAEPVLQIGDFGSAVSLLQSLLNIRIGAGLSTDGIFGLHTRAAVEAFQRDCGIAADGIVGPITWSHLGNYS